MLRYSCFGMLSTRQSCGLLIAEVSSANAKARCCGTYVFLQIPGDLEASRVSCGSKIWGGLASRMVHRQPTHCHCPGGGVCVIFCVTVQNFASRRVAFFCKISSVVGKVPTRKLVPANESLRMGPRALQLNHGSRLAERRRLAQRVGRTREHRCLHSRLPGARQTLAASSLPFQLAPGTLARSSPNC